MHFFRVIQGKSSIDNVVAKYPFLVMMLILLQHLMLQYHNLILSMSICPWLNNQGLVRLAGGWWRVLICCERKNTTGWLVAGGWC
jgi:hypothetical protein